ncbi:hypothetical protein CR513_10785, partial [Mucuna pruriens]
MAPTQRPHVGRESSRVWTVQAIGKCKPMEKQHHFLHELVGASESSAKCYCLLTMSRRYRNGKMNLWNNVYDISLSREQLIAKVPNGIHKDKWSSFVDYHLREEYQEKQIIPHTDGSKLLSTKHEMEVELGCVVGRGELYIATHKKKDGSYVNEEARFIGEKITHEISQSIDFIEISSNDSLSKVLGKDHAGHVLCLGLRGLHSSTTRFSGVGCNFSNFDLAESSRLKEEIISLKDKLASFEESVKTLKNIMLAYIQMKE